MRRFGNPFAALALAAGAPLVLVAGGGSLPQQDAIAVAAFVSSAATYVRQYQEELTSVVADETYSQQVRVQAPRDRNRPLRTRLTSEVFFMFTEGHDWMAIRDVTAVDGKPLATRPDLRLALRELPAPQVAARFKAYNSRFNVGRVRRNFNEPTLSLLVLDDRHRARFTFKRAIAERGDDPGLVRLTFREHQAPTLIRDLDGGPVFTSGELTVEPVTGRIVRTTLTLSMNSLSVTLATEYGIDERIGMAVPVRFTEHYLDGMVPRRSGTGRSTSRHEEIFCEAVYRNFQRFEVKTRIR